MSHISLNINGTVHKLEVEDRALLADVLRDKLKLTGTHVGCDTSQCGCCT
ncbi:MAG: (2Fe-2S)-binding protein, partial [Betaproteobacteria bacterium]|nr:(2Fe-2S)-binding protein [Betaproteobacteria bacterium]